MSKTGDIRIDKIMPALCEKWNTMDFEKCLMKTPSVTKVKVNGLLERGSIPIIDQGESFIAGYLNDESLLYSGDLPIILFGDHTRKIKYIDFPFAIGADGCKIFKPIDDIYIKFFLHYLLSLNITSQGYSRHYKFLKQIQVPIPTIDKQKRIVEWLEERLDMLYAACEKLDNVPLILKRFRQSVIANACSGKLTARWREDKNLPRWSRVAVEQVCNSINDGDHQPPPQVSEGIPFLVISNINAGKIDFNNTRYVTKEYFNNLKSNRIAQNGDVLYSIVGSYGIPVLVDTNKQFCFQRHIALFKPKNEILSKYLLYSLSNLEFYNKVTEIATGTAQLTVPIKGLRKIEILLPPLPEQEEIVRRVDYFFHLVDKIELQYKSSKTKLERAEKALYAKAFRGEM